MIEAEWWDYDSPDEMAEAVAGDVGFIVESALDARGGSDWSANAQDAQPPAASKTMVAASRNLRMFAPRDRRDRP